MIRVVPMEETPPVKVEFGRDMLVDDPPTLPAALTAGDLAHDANAPQPSLRQYAAYSQYTAPTETARVSSLGLGSQPSKKPKQMRLAQTGTGGKYPQLAGRKHRSAMPATPKPRRPAKGKGLGKTKPVKNTALDSEDDEFVKHQQVGEREWLAEQDDLDQPDRLKLLERNRAAANKCRLRKRDEEVALAAQERELETDNQVLQACRDNLQAEILSLKNMLLGHSHCDCVLIQKYIAMQAEQAVEAFPPGPENGLALTPEYPVPGLIPDNGSVSADIANSRRGSCCTIHTPEATTPWAMSVSDTPNVQISQMQHQLGAVGSGWNAVQGLNMSTAVDMSGLHTWQSFSIPSGCSTMSLPGLTGSDYDEGVSPGGLGYHLASGPGLVYDHAQVVSW